MSEPPPCYRRPSELSDDTLPPFSPSHASLSRRWILRQDSAADSSSEPAPSYHPPLATDLVADRVPSVTKPSAHVNWSAEPDLIEENPPIPVGFISLRVKTGDFEKAGSGGGGSGASAWDVEDDNSEDPNTLKPTMGWLSGANQCIGLMVGSGIFATPGKVVRYTGSPAMALVVWAFGGIVSLFGAMLYIELGCMLPQSGGEQAYLDVQYRKPRALVSFIFCWGMILLNRPGGESLDCMMFGQYLLFPAYGSMELVPRLLKLALAITVITIITVLNILSAKWAIRIHDCLTFVKIGMLLAVIFAGIVVATGLTSVPVAKDNWERFFTPGDFITPQSLALALFKTLWTFDGWNNLNYSLGELKDPVKNLPRATTFGVSMVVILYMFANTSYLLVLPQADMIAAEELVGGVFFKRIAGNIAGGIVFPILVAFSAFGGVCAMVYSASRVIQAAGVAGVLPFSRFLKRVHPVTKTPVNALIFNWFVTCIMILAPPPGAAYK
ncbi:hypothetical protein SmJEL517_g04810 [Synchytrium microbalum]|uniref:Amino acid permease/ SLC12A domain-containing protein n=1 Tax=Synchytrium microbalum TaxID=1806994 RepID=A0A507BSC5_9FUNG|nr:uncharacterized protein SmJEL517_g04810 [Synchytrium microbalum]TPX31977.1 hypothetical protein SmJEL517_g04810 [Synchytrium microbalum]